MYMYIINGVAGDFTHPSNLIDLSMATSQLKFLPTQVGKLWKAINANQKRIPTVCIMQQCYQNIEHC